MAKLICPACGAEALRETSNFCHECGTQLRAVPVDDFGRSMAVRPEAERRKPMEVTEWLIIPGMTEGKDDDGL